MIRPRMCSPTSSCNPVVHVVVEVRNPRPPIARTTSASQKLGIQANAISPAANSSIVNGATRYRVSLGARRTRTNRNAAHIEPKPKAASRRPASCSGRPNTCVTIAGASVASGSTARESVRTAARIMRIRGFRQPVGLRITAGISGGRI